MSSSISPLTRASLLSRMADSTNRAAWAEFIEIYGELIYRDIVRRGIADPDAEDVTQIVFVQLLSAMPKFHYQPARGKFRDWLGTLIRFEVSRFRRQLDRRRERLIDPDAFEKSFVLEADAEWSEAFQTRILTAALERSRIGFELRTWEAFLEVWSKNRAPGEVAAEFGTTVDWVYVAKSRALKAVAENVHLLMGGFPFVEALVERDS